MMSIIVKGERAMKTMIQKFFREEDGASAVEYGLLVALIAVALVAAMTALKGGVNTSFNNAKNSMSGS
jgi:pilus assembly protein Flp/PilA